MGVAQGHGQGLVAQELLHRHQVRPGHDQLGDEGVAGVMQPEVLDPGPPAGRGKGTLHVPVALSGQGIAEDVGRIQAPGEALQGGPPLDALVSPEPWPSRRPVLGGPPRGRGHSRIKGGSRSVRGAAGVLESHVRSAGPAVPCARRLRANSLLEIMGSGAKS